MTDWVGCCCLQWIRQDEVGIVEDLGQFKQVIGEGRHCISWPLQEIIVRLSLRDQQLDTVCNTNTKDYDSVQLGVSVQYKVIAESAYDAWYRLISPTSQIHAYVCDVIRTTVPSMTFHQAIEGKGYIAKDVLEQLQNVMKDYGRTILSISITYIVINMSDNNSLKMSSPENIETHSLCGYYSASAPQSNTIVERANQVSPTTSTPFAEEPMNKAHF